MKPRLMVVPGDASVISSLIPKLTQQGNLEVDTLPDFKTAIRSYNVKAKPHGVLTVINKQVPGLLELVITLDSITPRIPFLMLAKDRDHLSLPIKTGRTLSLGSFHQSSREILASVISIFSFKGPVQLFRLGIDYLLPTILSGRSVVLDFKLKAGSSAHVEILGGDIWNVYVDKEEALTALQMILREPIEQVSFRALHTVPGERQISFAGLKTLAVCQQNVLPQPESSLPLMEPNTEIETQEIHLGTVNIDVREIGADLQRTDPPQSAETLVDPAPQEESVDQKFNRQLTEGIEASLARDYARAAKAFEEALVLKPGDAKAEFNLARIRKHLK